MTIATKIFAFGFALIATVVVTGPALAFPATQATQTQPPQTPQSAEEPKPTLHQVELAPGQKVAYLLSEPSQPTAAKDRWMVVFLYGAGGSLTSYNLARPQYTKIRQALAWHGAYVVVPALGGLHFMNEQAKHSLSKVIDQVLVDDQIDPKHVHLMGTSMGAGSALAYAVSYPDRIRSVCAIMPMTDFAEWAKQKPNYAQRMTVAYGGTVAEKPQAYDVNSALKHTDAFAKIPVLLIHGTNDKTVPVSHSENLASILKAKGYPCTFIEVKDVGHSDDIVTGLQDQIVQFLMNANE